MTYRQLTSEERYMLSALRKQGFNQAQIARELGRHRSTICRELKRNSARWDGHYRPSKAIERTNGRRSRSRRNQRFRGREWQRVERLLREQWSPDQVSGYLRGNGLLRISHETIYRYIWADRRCGGQLHEHLRGRAHKSCRKRYRSYDSRGRLAGKRHISERPVEVETRQCVGHWEIDTVMGHGNQHCLVTLVERKSGYLLIGKLTARTTQQLNARTIALVQRELCRFHTITADNGTEFHSYRALEDALNVKFYFATPHQSWERGTNENTNGLIRQYFPKRTSLRHVTQRDCEVVARKLNTRPRKRHDYRTPQEVLFGY